MESKRTFRAIKNSWHWNR